MSFKRFTAELPTQLAARVDAIAACNGMTRDEAVQQALQTWLLHDEEERHRMTWEGLDDVDAGRVVSHDAIQEHVGALLHGRSSGRGPV
ncbi:MULTISPECIES: CopG family ribbon-helix-helix protein [Sphingomonadaceae]|jgi:predicted transcriptional regulator|uniref:CopG family ribbon-helix-helix protein n=1 Tax=Sphingomonadales TaxID=204457 RepID=UPI00181A5EB9|nr:MULTISPECIES: ribbon-helix-helix domain-containing protein [Sphingomonadaceae]MBA4762704.1 CopG family transcriptional regulator [Sphingomonas sp.]CAH0353854.1 hypothetical protein SPH9361_02709 [Sphingobium sp. CECT 9361]|tara:strand:- start:7776 stop:8042 length:267 start_codon:yes stop_codon:yes gene_type:complete